MPVSDPLGFDEDVVEPVDRIAADQRRAEYMATRGLDGDDQAAARAIGLEKITGVPASVITLDQDRFEAQHKASVTRAILHNNQWLADYANSHSMNATVSKDDWSRLDAVSGAFQKLGESPMVQVMAKQFQAQREGFRKGFGDAPLSDWVDRWEKYTQENQVKYPNIWNFITYNLAEAGGLWELAGRTTSGVMGAVHSSIETGLQQFGMPEDKAKSLAREFLGYVEFEMSGQRPTTTVGRTPGEIKAVKDARAEPAAREADAARPPAEVPPELVEANNAAMIAKPFLENGKLPPYGADPTINRILEFGLKHDLDLLDDVMEKSHKTDTINVPEAWNSFQNVHEMIANRKFGVDIDAINKLYGDKLPEPGDGILGDVPDIAQKIESARTGGSSTIDIPVRDLTHVQPEVYKELHDFIRTWDTGPSLHEIELAKTEGAPEKPPTVAVGSEPPEVRLLKSMQQASGLVVRPLGEQQFKNLIPLDKATSGVDVPDVQGKLSAKSLYTFKYKDLIDKLDYEQLSPENKIVSDFFGRYLKDTIGDVDVHVVSKSDIDKRLWPARPNTPAYHRWSTEDAFPQHIVFREDMLNGTEPTWFTQHLVLHEGVHGLTSMAIYKSAGLRNRIERVMSEANEWMRRMAPQSRKEFDYAFTNAHEFMAESLSNPGLREKLREVPISNTLARVLKMDEQKGTMWDAVRQILKDAWQKITGHAPTNSVLDAVLHIGNMVDELRADHADLAKLDKMAPTAGAEPIDPKAMGIGKKEQAAMLEKIKAEEEANQTYLQKVIERDERKRQTAQWKEDEARVRDEVTKQLQVRPDIAADQLTREGMLKGEKVGRIRLDEAKLTPEQKAMLSPEHYGSRGIDPGQLASHFGYYTDDAMINQLAKLEAQRRAEDLTPAAHFNRLRDVEVERRMKEQFGFLDDNIEREVKEHLLNSTVMDRLHDTFLRTGIRAGLKEGEIITKAKLQADAQKWMGEQAVGTISSDKLLAEIGRINARIRKEGNIGSATEQYKQMQNLQTHMYYAKEAIKYEREQAGQDRLFKQTGKRIITGVPEEWTNWIHTLMQKGGDDLVKRSPADLAERISKHQFSNFLEFAAEQEERGYPINMSENMFTDWRKPAEKMTLDEWRDWNGAIKTLYGYAKDAHNFEVGSQKRVWENHREFLIEQAKRERFTKDIPYDPNKTGFKLLSDWANRLFHGLIWNESVYNRVDHGNPHGLWKRSFSYYASSSVNRWEKWAKDYAKDLEKETKPFDVPLRKDVEPILIHPFRGDPIKLNRENARQMVGYMGTVSGEDKLIRGYMFPWKMDADGKITPPEISKEDYAAAQQKLRKWFEKNTTKEDWNFWEKVFKLNEGAWNKYEDMVTKQGAVPAQRVALNPIDIHGKTYEGGYTPLSYDREIAQTSKKISGMAVDPEDAIGNGGIFRVTTPRSHEKARTGYSGPLYLKMDRNAGMMSNVLRDAAIRPFVINSMKAYTDVVFQNAVKEYLGNHVHAMLVPQIKSIAGMGPGLSQTAALAEKTLEYFSQNTVARLVGGNINTLGKHTLSAAVNSVTMVGLRPLVREAAGQWDRGDLHPTMTNREFIIDALLGLQRRKQVVLESMGGQWAERTGKRDKWRDLMAEWGSKAIGQFDLESAIPTAIAEFKRSKIQQIKETGDWDFSLARDAAERMVRAAHGDTAVSTRPEFMRAGAMAKTLSRLYTFFNANLQRNYEALWRGKAAARAWSEGDIASAKKDAAIATKMWISANLYIALIEEMISPLPYSKDEDWGTWAGKTMLYAGTGMIPIVREAVHAWLAGYPTTLGILDTGLKPLGEGVKLLASGKAFDDEHGGKTLKALNSIYGTLKGHTNDEIGNLLKYGWDITHQSKESPEGLDEHFREIFHGRAHEPKPHR